MIRWACLTAAVLALAGCETQSAIQANSTPSVSRPQLLREPSIGSSASKWSSSAEYAQSGGLAVIRAAQGYANRTGGKPAGKGVTVAVLDTGIDVKHSDLNPGEFTYTFVGDSEKDLDGHGTHVAGIIAARRDGHGMHGVAYNATLKSIKALRDYEVIDGVTYKSGSYSDEIALSVYSAAGIEKRVPSVIGDVILPATDVNGNIVYDFNGNPEPLMVRSKEGAVADIMNMSLGGGDPDTLQDIAGNRHKGHLMRFAMKAAAEKGVIMVVALGNDRVSGPSAYPAGYAADPKMKGLVVAVGALNRAGTKPAKFSNLCGPVKAQCIFAPGTKIRSTYKGGGYHRLSGTSMATPHVTGALAVLMAAFPNQSPRALVKRIFNTAARVSSKDTTLNAAKITGHGKLDLGAAMMPFGAKSVPVSASSAGAQVSLEATSLLAPSGLSVEGLQASLKDVLTYDSMNFQFFTDLGQRVTAEPDDRFLENFVTGLGTNTYGGTFGGNTSVSFSVADEPKPVGQGFAASTLGGTEPDTRQIESAQIAMRAGPNTILRLRQGSAAPGFAAERIGAMADGLIVDPKSSANPYLALTRSATSLQLEYDPAAGTALAFGVGQGETYFGGGEARSATVSLTQSAGPVRLGWDAGLMGETDAALGMQANGAFSPGLGAETGFVSAHAAVALSETQTLVASATVGQTRIADDGNGLLSDYTGGYGTAFQLGAVERDLFGRDELRLGVSQPFRVESLKATLTKPTGDDADGVIAQSHQTVQLAPQAREIVLQAVYSRRLDDAPFTVDLGAFSRFNPNHQNAAPDLGGAIRLVGRF